MQCYYYYCSLLLRFWEECVPFITDSVLNFSDTTSKVLHRRHDGILDQYISCIVHRYAFGRIMCQILNAYVKYFLTFAVSLRAKANFGTTAMFVTFNKEFYVFQ